ncbi:hypothetical protein [Streptomyces sp. NPDC008137]|uniref:hypothetical protein n=1 Tax=Streptomyces sp. NPDC008137 TaxID=3364813 RepID=UPI0036E2C279
MLALRSAATLPCATRTSPSRPAATSPGSGGANKTFSLEPAEGGCELLRDMLTGGRAQAEPDTGSLVSTAQAPERAVRTARYVTCALQG